MEVLGLLLPMLGSGHFTMVVPGDHVGFEDSSRVVLTA